MNPSQEYPLTDDELFLFSPATCRGLAGKAFYGQLATKLLVLLNTGIGFDKALEKALEYLEDESSLVYREMSVIFQEKERLEKRPSLKARYRLLADAFENCGTNPRNALSYVVQKYQNVKDDRKKLEALLVGSKKGQDKNYEILIIGFIEKNH
ncbi:MAG: hypothetical protein H0W50_00290 [Parachlamydiaceae bacterium]|nr:hypothetical protein [Parachlamydiaceae bacterium]